VLDIRLREGRLFNDSDVQSAERVALVDEAFVARHLSGGPAIGRTKKEMRTKRVRTGGSFRPRRPLS